MTIPLTTSNKYWIAAIVVIVWMLVLPASCNGKGHALDSGYTVGINSK